MAQYSYLYEKGKQRIRLILNYKKCKFTVEFIVEFTVVFTVSYSEIYSSVYSELEWSLQ